MNVEKKRELLEREGVVFDGRGMLIENLWWGEFKV